MVTRSVIVHEDGVAIDITGGEVYEQKTESVDPGQFNRERLEEKAINGIAVLEADHDTVDAADNAQMKVIVKHLLKAAIWLARLQLRQLQSTGPAE